MKKIALAGLIGIAAVMVCVAGNAVRAAEGGKQDGRVFEMRTYIANPGKLDALNARFRDHTCKLFKKHGIDIIGFWTPTEGEAAQTTLVYLLAFPSVEAQKNAWAAFREDEDWKKAKAASEVDGVLVKQVISVNLAPTDYSPIK